MENECLRWIDFHNFAYSVKESVYMLFNNVYVINATTQDVMWIFTNGYYCGKIGLGV